MRSLLLWAIPICFFVHGCQNHPIKQVCFKTTCVDVEISDTPEKRKAGLMFHKGLADNQGMLFIFEKQGSTSFWMKNMGFPLDIIWIDEQMKAADIKTNCAPCGVTCENLIPKRNAKFVLEVNAGFVKRYEIRIGDRVRFH